MFWRGDCKCFYIFAKGAVNFFILKVNLRPADATLQVSSMMNVAKRTSRQFTVSIYIHYNYNALAVLFSPTRTLEVGKTLFGRIVGRIPETCSCETVGKELLNDEMSGIIVGILIVGAITHLFH